MQKNDISGKKDYEGTYTDCLVRTQKQSQPEIAK
jgi:hypothetical protein